MHLGPSKVQIKNPMRPTVSEFKCRMGKRSVRIWNNIDRVRATVHVGFRRPGRRNIAKANDVGRFHHRYVIQLNWFRLARLNIALDLCRSCYDHRAGSVVIGRRNEPAC